MGKHFALAMQLPVYRTRAAKKNEQSAKKINITTEQLGAGIIVVTAALLLFYLFQVNNFSTAGYQIRQLQSKVNTLTAEHQKLEAQAADLQSIQRIQNDPAVLNMVPVASINYIRATALTER